jgi:hypothetical protein
MTVGPAICPNCGQESTFSVERLFHVETHGLDCGPYEHFDEVRYTCKSCGAHTNEKELDRENAAA